MTSDPSDRAIAALLQQHDELVQLYIHEDALAWQLNLTLLGADAGLFAAAGGLGAFDAEVPVSFPLIAVLAAGALINVVGFFVLQRSKIHRTSRLFRGLHLEADLLKSGISVDTFASAEGYIHSNRMLLPPQEQAQTSAELPTRPLRRWEKVESLNLRFSFNLLAAVFIGLIIWVAFFRG